MEANKSVFDFLKDDDEFYDIYKCCRDMEKAIIFKTIDTTFFKGRKVCENLIKKIAKNNPKVSYLFSSDKHNGKSHGPEFSKILGACRDKKVISRNIINKFYEIKKLGNVGAHELNVDKYDMTHCKNFHKMVFDITVDCYNKFNYPKNVSYYYGLDKVHYKIEYMSDDRKEDLNDLRVDEVDIENIEEYYKSNDIFLLVNSFKRLASKYIDINENEEFFNELEKYTNINDENIDEVLSDVEEEVRSKIKVGIEKFSQDKSNKIIETLNELNNDLTFGEINELIASANDEDKREIYRLIKEISSILAKNYLNGPKEELEEVPVTYIDENGEKVCKHEKYDIEEDENGFFLKICLDEEQKAAVRYNGDKPLVINAGPGSGKTRILVERVVYLINELNMDPSTILIITFTNKAAQEFKNRLINDANLPRDIVYQVRIDTIYGFCRYLINMFSIDPYNYLKEGEKFIFFSNFKKELGFKNYAYLYDSWIPRVLEVYAEIVNFGVDIEKLIDYVKSKMDDMDDVNYRRYIDDFHEKYGHDQFPDYNDLIEHKFQRAYYYQIFLNIAYSYERYKQLQKQMLFYDMDHLIETAYEVLNGKNWVHGFWQNNILIDEFQDIDFHQMKIFNMLQESCINRGGTFTLVGDSDQSIYGWRGSSSRFFENCVSDPNFQCITIYNNYRSSSNIVEFNEELIKPYRLIEKNSIPIKSGANPVFYLSNCGSDEVINIMQIIRGLKEDKKINYYSDIALLFRTNRDIEKFVEVFDEHSFPYYNLARHDFLNQNEVKSMLTLFWLLMPYEKNKFVNRSDDFLNLSWLSDDYFGLSKETQEILNDIQINFEKNVIKLAHKAARIFDKHIRLVKYSNIFNLDKKIIDYVFDNVETFDLISLDESCLIKLGITDNHDLEFFSKLRNLKSIMWGDLSDSEKPDFIDVFNSLINITDYYEAISIRSDDVSLKIKDNLALFSQIIYEYEEIILDKDYLGLFNYLNNVLGDYRCHIRNPNEKFNKVHLMTMHIAKGLEYPVVMVCSLKDRKKVKHYRPFQIPNHIMSNNPLDFEKFSNDEEMKLIYVATTRARDLLILSSVNSNGRLPEFLETLKKGYVKIESLRPYNLTNIEKISSSIIRKTKIVKTLNLEEILSDYLFCPYKYDVLDNTRFHIKLNDSESRYAENYSRIKLEYLENHDIISSFVSLRKQFTNCEIYGKIDFIVREKDNEISIVKFIDSDDKISGFIDEYMYYLYFYTSILKTHEKFKGYKFKNIILYSCDNNNVHSRPYQRNIEESVLDNLKDIATNIVEEKFHKKMYRCNYCECNDNHCYKSLFI